MNPGELLEISGYFWKTCALHASIIHQNSPGHIHRPGEFWLPQVGEIQREQRSKKPGFGEKTRFLRAPGRRVTHRIVSLCVASPGDTSGYSNPTGFSY